jgi:predicted MPP superfamily phosphohydrolase
MTGGPRSDRSVLHPTEALAGAAFFLAFSLAAALAVHVVVRWIAGWDVRWPGALDSALARATAVAVLALETAVAIWARFVEPRLLGVTRLELPSAKITSRIRIVFLSDMHVERRWTAQSKVVAHVRGAGPDLILLGGDYLNSLSGAARRTLYDTVASFVGTAPTYGVEGNTDIRRPAALEIVKDAGLTVLRGERREVAPGIDLTGVDFLDSGALEAAARSLDASRFNICLTHEPSLMLDAAAPSFDLILAGHTHGGQIRLPWYGALVTLARLGKRVEMGRYRIGGLTGYVTRGVGLAGGLTARVRILCRPEVVIVDLVPRIA